MQLRNVRLAAFEDPGLFVMEFETAPLDLEWLRQLDTQYEARYQDARRAGEAAKDQRERALHAELDEQGRRDPELERRFKAQEAEREAAEQAAKEEAERHKLEQDLPLKGALLIGFHYE